LIALVVLSALSALSAAPAFTADGVPAAVLVLAGVAIGITVVGIVLVAPALRGKHAPVAA
jgi:hypothetical protein